MVEVLGAFPARPPTPPRASSNVLIDGDGNRAQSRLSVLRTPGDSPLSTNGLTNLPSGGQLKKVNFSPFPPYVIKPPTFHATSTPNSAAKDLSHFSAGKPFKSILKATTTTSHLESPDEEPQTSESFAMLLESVTQQLAGESLSSRVDAYIHLLGALKAYDGVPEQEALLSKLGLLCQFIQRDVNRDLEKGEVVEQNLTTNALKLGILFIWSAPLLTQLPDDFKIFIVDQSLNALQDGKLPKSVLNHYVHVLSTQNFPPKIMTNSRLTRILVVLSDVTDRVSGNGIVSQRLSVYQRLLSQSKTVMASEPGLWIENLISGMLHPIKDTRSKAISLGMQAAATLGPNLDVSNTILATFEKELSQGRRLVSEICERMSRMMSSIESGMHVPQIWSILVLLMRSRRFNIEQWRHFKEWTLILQKCFNCSEPAIKAQATVGWNRFVYAINPSESTSSSMMKMLSKPIISGIERRKNEKPEAPISALMLSSYYNLLYYGFRPASSYKHFDYVWDEWVEQPFVNVFGTSQQPSEFACRVLSCLLWSSQPRLWNENKVNEVTKFEPEHLVPLDSRWTRSRIAPILKAFDILFKSSSWERGTNVEPWIATAWISLSSALADASSKEIKPSAELMHAIASVLGFFQRLWHGAPASLNGNTSGEFMERFSFLSTTIIATIGTSPFTEKVLLKTAQETFLTATTPTHRRSHVDTDLDTPFAHLLRIVSSNNEFPESSDSYSKLIDSVLECGSKGRQSRGSRLEFLEKCNEVCQLETELQSSGPILCRRYLWEAVAKLTMKCLNSHPLETKRDRDGTVSRDYDNVIKILSRGLQIPDAHMAWGSLLDAFVRSVRTERGERGIATLIVEPLSENLRHLGPDQVCLPLKAVINQALSLPYYQQTKLRSPPFGLNHGSSAPDQVLFPIKLLELVDKVLSEFYQHSKHTQYPEIAEVVESLTSLLGSGVLQFRSAVLDKLQGPLALWLSDSARHLTLEDGADSRLLTACRTLSLAIANLLQTAVPHDCFNLTKFEDIVSAGLESTHKSTANRFIEMWNETFGLQDIVTLPATIQSALQKLEPFVDLQLPSHLPLRAESQMDQEMHDFVDSQDTDLGNDVRQPSNNEYGRSPFGAQYKQISRPKTFSSSPIVQAAEWDHHTLIKKRDETTPKRRLRHQDSQIQFVAVESSPRPSDQESQHLTNHQIEVKERQRGETSLFLQGLRSSSPVLPSPIKATEAPSPVQLPNLRNLGPTFDIPLTPTLAPNVAENDDDFPGSSPTPGTKTRTDSDSQMHLSLSIQPLEPFASDPPSSPPETKVRSPSGRRITRQASALRRSESLVEVNAGFMKDHEKDDPINIDSSVSGRELGDATTILSEAHDETGQPLDQQIAKSSESQKAEEAESTPRDVIPDSYSDDVELQLASQLEQEIELAVDNDDIHESQMQSGHAQSFPVTRKRKRAAAAEAASELTPPNRSKRRSLRHSSISDKDTVKENVEIIKTVSKPTLPSKAASTPLSLPSKHKGVSDSPNPAIESGPRRRSRRLIGDADSEIASSPAKSESPPLKKRKSTRLEEIATSRTSEAEPASRTPRSQRLRDRAATSVHSTSTPVGKSTQAQHRKCPLTQVVNIDGENRKDNPDELETEQPAVSEEPISITETFADENEEIEAAVLRGNSQDTDVVMNEATNDLMETAPVRTRDYVSHALQTDDVVEQSDVPGGSILDSLRRVLSDIKKATIGRSFLREMDDMMFDIRVEAHEAAKRYRE